VAAVDPRAALDYARQQGHAFVLPHAVALVGAEEAFVREAHAEGIRVGTWTVDDEATLERLFAWNVDAVASNDPALAVAVRDRLAQ
jgi:glycerophosphoryl diester phosphodiesterase